MKLFREFDRLLAVARLADDFHVRLILEHSTKATANQTVVIHEQHCDLLFHRTPLSTRLSLLGTVRWTSVPPSVDARIRSDRPLIPPCLRIATRPMPRLFGLSAKPLPWSCTSNSSVRERKRKRTAACFAPEWRGDIVQSFLEHAVNVHPSAAIHRKWLALLVIGYCNAGLSFHGGDVPIKGALKPSFIEHDWVQRLRQTAYVFKGRLHGLQDFLQIRAEGRTSQEPVSAGRGASMEPTSR